MTLKESIEYLVSLGVPGSVLFFTIISTGLSGAAAITAALVIIGPGGMIGGILTLLASSVIIKSLSEFGLDYLIVTFFKKYMDTHGKHELIDMINKIRKYRVISEKDRNHYISIIQDI